MTIHRSWRTAWTGVSSHQKGSCLESHVPHRHHIKCLVILLYTYSVCSVNMLLCSYVEEIYTFINIYIYIYIYKYIKTLHSSPGSLWLLLVLTELVRNSYIDLLMILLSRYFCPKVGGSEIMLTGRLVTVGIEQQTFRLGVSHPMLLHYPK